MSRLLPARAACMLALLLLPALAAPAFPAAPSANLLLNPGFEDVLEGHPWMAAAWDTSESGLPTVFFGRDTFLVHGGQYSVNVANLSMVNPVWHNWHQAVLVGPEAWGRDVVLSVWTRSNGLRGRGYILVQAYRDTIGKMAKSWDMDRDAAGRRMGINKIDDPLLDLGWKRLYFSEPETEWVRREVRVFVPPTVNVIYVRCGLFGTGQVVFDDASLTLVDPQPPAELPVRANLLADPGFEGDGNGWEYATPPYDGMRVERDTTEAHSGKASIFSESGGTGMIQVRTGVCQVFSNRNLAGKKLRASAWVKTDSLKGTAFLKIYAHTLHGMVQSPTTTMHSMNTPWTEASAEMETPPDTYEVWVWYLYNAPVPGRVWFDDCSFEVLGPAEPRSAGRPTK